MQTFLSSAAGLFFVLFCFFDAVNASSQSAAPSTYPRSSTDTSLKALYPFSQGQAGGSTLLAALWSIASQVVVTQASSGRPLTFHRLRSGGFEPQSNAVVWPGVQCVRLDGGVSVVADTGSLQGY